jgi:hypothetical protein
MPRVLLGWVSFTNGLDGFITLSYSLGLGASSAKPSQRGVDTVSGSPRTSFFLHSGGDEVAGAVVVSGG